MRRGWTSAAELRARWRTKPAPKEGKIVAGNEAARQRIRLGGRSFLLQVLAAGFGTNSERRARKMLALRWAALKHGPCNISVGLTLLGLRGGLGGAWRFVC